jgi:hypothetical protein
VLVSHGTVQLGRLPEPSLTGLRTTFAEGQCNGGYAQVFGALRAEPVRVPHTPLRLRLEYASNAIRHRQRSDTLIVITACTTTRPVLS